MNSYEDNAETERWEASKQMVHLSALTSTYTTPTSGHCRECGTEGAYDEKLRHLRLCFWCAELQRIRPHPVLPNPMRKPEYR